MNSSFSVAFDVTPLDRWRLELKTGEVFQNQRYAALRKEEDKMIGATLFVAPKEHDSFGVQLPSEMRYRPDGDDGRSELFLIWRMSDNDLATFHNILLSGKMPKQAVLFTLSPNLDFGCGPDGMRQKWNNEIIHVIPIENVSFNFDLCPLNGGLFTAEGSVSSPREDPFGSSSEVVLAIINNLTKIQKSIDRIYWIIALLSGVFIASVVMKVLR